MGKALNANPLSVLPRVYVRLKVVDKQAILNSSIADQRQIFGGARPRHVLKLGKPSWGGTLLYEHASDCAKSCLVYRGEHYDARELLSATLKKVEKPGTRNLAHRVRDERAFQIER